MEGPGKAAGKEEVEGMGMYGDDDNGYEFVNRCASSCPSTFDIFILDLGCAATAQTGCRKDQGKDMTCF